MPRKVNRHKKHSYILTSPPPSPLPPPPPETLFKRIVCKTNYLLREHPYIIFIIPIIYELYNSYKKENNININV